MAIPKLTLFCLAFMVIIATERFNKRRGFLCPLDFFVSAFLVIGK